MQSNQDQDRNTGKRNEPGFELLCASIEHDVLLPEHDQSQNIGSLGHFNSDETLKGYSVGLACY
jgi:hypothetical protein